MVRLHIVLACLLFPVFYIAEANASEKHYQLALRNFQNDNFEQAITNLSVGAGHGHLESQVLLMGLAAEVEDFDTSLFWMREAAKQGHFVENIGIEPFKLGKGINLKRGLFQHPDQDVLVLNKADSCSLVKLYGWEICAKIETVLVGVSPQLQTILIQEPDSDGYVDLSDWDTVNKKEQIAEIENLLRQALNNQSKASGTAITFKGWRQYPTLNQTEKIMYYATDMVWEGHAVTNINVVKFDRYGFINLTMAPFASDLGESQITRMAIKYSKSYRSNPDQRYAAFSAGDKIATIGAMGILARNLGVNWNKSAMSTGLGAILLGIVKKFWFFLLLPFVFVGRLFSKKDN